MNSFKKIFAIDLDGTLLSKTKKIKKRDLDALKKYHDNGGEIIIITGKCVSSGLKYVRLIEKTNNIKLKYASFLSGAIVYDLQEDKIIFESKISSDNMKYISTTCLKNKCDFLSVLQTENTEHFVVNKNWLFNFIWNIIYIKNRPTVKIKNFSDFSAHKVNTTKRIFHLNNLNNLKKILQQKQLFNICDINSFFYEITNFDASKEKALKFIANKLNVDILETAAIGDSANDISMLNVANISFGIDNKKEEFRKAAKVLIKKTQKNPVAFAIDYMFNK